MGVPARGPQASEGKLSACGPWVAGAHVEVLAVPEEIWVVSVVLPAPGVRAAVPRGGPETIGVQEAAGGFVKSAGVPMWCAESRRLMVWGDGRELSRRRPG